MEQEGSHRAALCYFDEMVVVFYEVLDTKYHNKIGSYNSVRSKAVIKGDVVIGFVDGGEEELFPRARSSLVLFAEDASFLYKTRGSNALFIYVFVSVEHYGSCET